MLRLDLQLLLARLTNPMVFALYERVVMDSLPIIRGTNVAFHGVLL